VQRDRRGSTDLAGSLDELSVRTVLRSAVPTVAQESVLPLLVFYAAWRVGGLALGIGLSLVASLAVYAHGRRRGRPGLLARLSLLAIVIQAAVGLASGSAAVFLAQPVLVNAAWGLAHLGTAIAGRPLAGVFAQAILPLPDEARSSSWYRAAFGRISLAWAALFLGRSGLRLAVLVTAGVEPFLLVTVVTGLPALAALGAWSSWYALRTLRRLNRAARLPTG